MPPYVVKELQTKEQLDAVVDVIWKAQYSPYMPSSSIFFPVSGYTPEDRAAGISASKERLWKEHLSSSPAEHTWIFVEDSATSEIVAGSLWEWHEKNKVMDGIPKIDMYWWPNGEAREFCEEMLRQCMTPRSLWMHRPNAGVSMMVVHPEHRKRGVGGLMMQWSNRKLDEGGIEGFVEASELGRELYEKWGYRVVMKIALFLPPNKGDIWNKLAHEMMLPPWYAMWRPVNGVVKAGERNRPWQLVPPLHP
ncbi:hypothetical protein G7Y89_g2403 [Cudoniella acicularis]|uniref:N-acetyltransferase domain-containing protein n=1 Tax=Cudoniella acicularis TaxID=354080 RepID=A0A8H4W6Z6_9HELO|nr:hypothetical protein G7Y89_g2403 [Cudoniella acicularis]